MKSIYKFKWDCGRRGKVEGVFSATKEQIGKAIGNQVYFGEILGKHSEVYGELEESDLTELTNDQSFIAKAEEFGLIPSGYNPLDYIDQEDEQADEGESEE